MSQVRVYNEASNKTDINPFKEAFMTPKRILIVDDDPQILDLLATFFAHCHNSRTCKAQDSETAFKELHRKPFDVILTNIHRPGMDGLAFTRRVCRLSGPPVMVLTGDFNPMAQQQAFASGALACLRKPVKLSQLVEIMELVVSKGMHYIGTGDKAKSLKTKHPGDGSENMRQPLRKTCY
ncbi:MAG: response regulator [Desulfobacteraceae bacterium]|nr:response regulator [Desulfobacteraceae bacterium]MBU4053491.1 response regulator [Pseudomonadota bacterium]